MSKKQRVYVLIRTYCPDFDRDVYYVEGVFSTERKMVNYIKKHNNEGSFVELDFEVR